MDVFLLGSGGMMPMPRRRLTAALVRTQVTDYLFDAGEGVQVAFKELGLGIKRLTVVAVTHLHADHCLGLPGLLMLRSQVEEVPPLTIVGPRGIRRFVQHVRSDLKSHVTFPIRFVELDPSQGGGIALRSSEVVLRWARLDHTVPCVGYRLEEPDRPGRFRPEEARRLCVPEGPLWGRLQRGQDVVLEDGRMVRPGQVMDQPRRGRALAYATDTRPCPGLEHLAHEVDLALFEGMFLEEDADLAKEKGHMTCRQAATAAKAAMASRLVLVHLSPRYHDGQRRDMAAQAQAVFPGAEVGHDLQFWSIPLVDAPPRSPLPPAPPPLAGPSQARKQRRKREP